MRLQEAQLFGLDIGDGHDNSVDVVIPAGLHGTSGRGQCRTPERERQGPERHRLASTHRPAARAALTLHA